MNQQVNSGMNKETMEAGVFPKSESHGRSPENATTRVNSSEPAPGESHTTTILLADEPGIGREFVRRVLDAEPYRLVSARDGAEVVAALKSKAVDLVILSN